MLEKFLNKEVAICISNYAVAADKISNGVKRALEMNCRKGKVTAIDSDFIELDNNEVIAIRYITRIYCL